MMAHNCKAHDCKDSPERCYLHEPYSVHPVFEGGYQIYDPSIGDGVYVGSDGRAWPTTRGKKWFVDRAEAERVAAELDARNHRYD